MTSTSTSAPSRDADFSPIGKALADPSRAAMLSALMTGTAWTVGELASHAGVARSTASEHVHHLAAAGLVEVTHQGRHAYVVLAGPQVAEALEALSLIAPTRPAIASLRAQRNAGELAVGRTCYRHLAGRVGVGLTDLFTTRGLLGDDFTLTESGRDWFVQRGIDCETPARTNPLRACLDWTERRPHLAGPLADRLARHAFDHEWIERGSHPRSVRLTELGAKKLGLEM